MKTKQGIPRLLEIAGKKKIWLIFSALISVVSTAAQFIPYIAIYKILKELALNATKPEMINNDYIWYWCYITLGSFVVYCIFLFASLMLSHIAAFDILYEFRVKLSNKLAKLPLGFFSDKTSGSIKKVMSDDVERIELFIAHHIPDIVSSLLFPAMLIIYMFIIDWRLALVAMCIFIAALLIIAQMNNSRMKTVADEYVKIMGRMNGSIVEFVKGIQVVKIFTKSTKAFERLNNNINDFQNYAFKITQQWSTPYIGFNLILAATTLLIVPPATYFLLKADSYPDYIPTVLMFILFSGSMFFPMLKLIWIGGVISQVTVGVNQIDSILQEYELPQHTKQATLKGYSVEFDKVSFAYSDDTVLEDINFIAHEGTITALVGPSGGGKSTLAMLIARFWDVATGEIKIGGVPVKMIPIEQLMNIISFVFQDSMLFFDTIEENIRMGNTAASFEEVTNAAKAAQCHEFISKLPNGYKTLVGEGGTYLSGGEQQRISLARAILKDAPIVLLDEATAYADPENESKILESFSHLIRGKTIIVIAHRLNTVVNSDQILYINNKSIQENGTHEELLAQNQNYARMWNSYSTAQNWVISNTNGEG